MSNSNFPNIDFGFRIGNRSSLDKTDIKDGMFNVCRDTEELFIDKDNNRYYMGSVILGYSDYQLSNLDMNKRKSNKLYLADDTRKLYTYDNGVKTPYTSQKSIEDDHGHVINDYYYPKSSALDNQKNIESELNTIHSEIATLQKYNVVVCESPADLPTEGTNGFIYFVNETNGDDNDNTNDVYNMYVYLKDDTVPGGGYYSKIGVTTIDLKDYYTKKEVDDLLAKQKADIEKDYNDKMTKLQETIDALQSSLNTLKSYTESNFTTTNSNVSKNAGNIAIINTTLKTKLTYATANITNPNFDSYNMNGMWSVTESTNGASANAPVYEEGELQTINAGKYIHQFYTTKTNTYSRLYDGSKWSVWETYANNVSVTSLANRVTTNEKNITNLRTDLANTQTSGSSNSTEIISIKNDISSNKSSINTINNTIDTMQTQISTNTKNITVNANNITTNKNDIATNKKNIGTNSTNIATLQTNVKNNTDNISTNTKNIKTNADNIASNKSSIDTNASNITSINSKLSKVETTANNANTLSKANKSALDNIYYLDYRLDDEA